MRQRIEEFVAENATGERGGERDRRVVAFIVQLVGLERNVPSREIFANTRRADAALARQVSIYLVHTVFAWPLGRIGAAFQRDRSTISYACRKVEDLRDDERFDGRLTQLERCLRAAPVEPAV